MTDAQLIELVGWLMVALSLWPLFRWTTHEHAYWELRRISVPTGGYWTVWLGFFRVSYSRRDGFRVRLNVNEGGR